LDGDDGRGVFHAISKALIEGNTGGYGGGVRRTDGAGEALGNRKVDGGGIGLNVVG
jgi:hypothetical protein